MTQDSNGQRRVRWTRYLVPHRDSLWFIGFTLLTTVLSSSAVAYFIWWMLHDFVADLDAMGLLRSPTLRAEIMRYQENALYMWLIGVGVMAGTVGTVTAYLLHRVVGPIFHLERHLEQLQRGGEVKPLRFRRSDRLQRIADLVNATTRGRDDDTKGFTLIELMIVVAIIGILASLAVSSLGQFSTRARQSEAKSNLKSLFVAIKGEQALDNQECGFCGWSISGEHVYNYYASPDPGARISSGSGGCAEADGEVEAAAQLEGAFTASAVGNIDHDPTCDGWNINDFNDLAVKKNDVSD